MHIRGLNSFADGFRSVASPQSQSTAAQDGSHPIGTQFIVTSPSIPVIGLVGGIGAGKSAVARALQAILRAEILDADQAGHRALLDESVRSRLVGRFGPEILSAAGEIDRKKLARLVFGDSAEQRTNRRDLEAVVHPWIRADLLARLEAIRQRGETDVVLLDAPILLESGWDSICDAVAYVDTPWEVRLARVASRGWTAEELQRREASQMPLDEKRRRSDVILDNSGPVDTAAKQLARALPASRWTGAAWDDRLP